MERLTIKAKSIVGKHYGLKCMLNEDYTPYGVMPKEISCNDYCAITRPDACLKCGIQAAFDKLAAYEDTGLTPEEIKKLQEVNVLLTKQADLAHKAILAIEKEINQ